MPTTPEFDDVHVTEAVRFCVLLSAKVPVAVNCCEELKARVGFAGVTTIEIRDGGETDSALATIIPLPLA
jgi:hypothetical protein